MKTARLAYAFAALAFASNAGAHGPGQGALTPHAHPHAEEAFGGWGMLLVAATIAAVVGMVVREIAKRR